jgi:tetratricopeptide (TPR) repeat protein
MSTSGGLPIQEKTALDLLEGAQLARREHRLADAHRDLVEAVRLVRQSGERRDLIRALKALGQIERDLGRGDAARPLYEEAVTISREDGDPLMLAHTIRHLGDIHRDAKRLADAELCYHEALALYRANEAAPLDLANAIRPFAILKEATGKAEEARPFWEEARELYAAVNVQEGVAECARRLARLNR